MQKMQPPGTSTHMNRWHRFYVFNPRLFAARPSMTSAFAPSACTLGWTTAGTRARGLQAEHLQQQRNRERHDQRGQIDSGVIKRESCKQQWVDGLHGTHGACGLSNHPQTAGESGLQRHAGHEAYSSGGRTRWRFEEVVQLFAARPAPRGCGENWMKRCAFSNGSGSSTIGVHSMRKAGNTNSRNQGSIEAVKKNKVRP